ncbi:MAG: glycosyltransferase [Balneolaceae bacterium]
MTPPLATIAICTWNRAGYLADTLRDLGRQTAPTDRFEVLVVDNNSSDSTGEVTRDFISSHPGHHVRYVTEEKQGLSHARNCAWREAKADAVVYIDDDVILPETYVETLLRYLETRPAVRAAGGRILVRFDGVGEPPRWLPHPLMPMFGLHDLGDEEQIYRNNFPRGGNMVIRKKLLKQLGGFDTRLGRSGDTLAGSEEKALFERATEEGETLHYWGELLLYHRIGAHRLEPDYMERQSTGIGQSERIRVAGQPFGVARKLFSELVKGSGSLILSAGYLIAGRPGAAAALLRFRRHVLTGFLCADGSHKDTSQKNASHKTTPSESSGRKSEGTNTGGA